MLTMKEVHQQLLQDRLNTKVAHVQQAWGVNPEMLAVLNKAMTEVEKAAKEGHYGPEGLSAEGIFDNAVHYTEKIAQQQAAATGYEMGKIAADICHAAGITSVDIQSLPADQQEKLGQWVCGKAAELLMKQASR